MGQIQGISLMNLIFSVVSSTISGPIMLHSPTWVQHNGVLQGRPYKAS